MGDSLSLSLSVPHLCLSLFLAHTVPQNVPVFRYLSSEPSKQATSEQANADTEIATVGTSSIRVNIHTVVVVRVLSQMTTLLG